MNERQRDLFLWQWSQRRTRGLAQVGRRGALIGAGGGLLFSAFMLHTMGAPAAAGHTGLAALLPVIERAALLLALTVPTLAVMGFVHARRVFNLHERMYRSMLDAGARVPAQAPVLQAGDRWPAIAVGVTVALMAAAIGGLVWAAGSGRL